MDTQAKIDKVIFKIGNKEIVLTLSQAKDLQGLLNDTFRTVPIVVNNITTIPYIPPINYCDPYITPWWTREWCNSSSNTIEGAQYGNITFSFNK